MSLKHSITDSVFFHRWNLDALVILLLILSRIVLPILPISDLLGLLSRQVDLLAKFGLWSVQCYEYAFVSCGVHPVIDAQFCSDVFVF